MNEGSEMAGLREKKKSNNRRKIVKSAKSLVRSMGSTEFTMKELAAKAGLSTFTVHQYFRTKSSIIFNVLMDVLDDIKTGPLPVNPSADEVIDYFMEFGDSPVDLYLENEEFYRAILGHFMSDHEQAQRLEYQEKARSYWKFAVSSLKKFNVFSPDLNEMDIIRAVQISFTGVMEMWVHYELSSSQLRSQIRSVLALNLIACTTEECREKLYNIVRESRY
ncbi:MAG: TetR/AcrR family transcriptional regulator [Novosphingobium sp.]